MNDHHGNQEFERDGLPISWIAASFSLLVGITMTYVPYRFAVSLSGGFYSHIRLLGLGFLGGGVLLWLSFLYPRGPWHLGSLGRICFAASLLFYWGATNLRAPMGSQGLPESVLYPLLLAGTVVELSPGIRRWGRRWDIRWGLLSPFMAALAGGLGLLMLALPGQLPSYLLTEPSGAARFCAVSCLLGAVGLTGALWGRCDRARQAILGLLALPLGGLGYLLGRAGSWPTMELLVLLGMACALAAVPPPLRGLRKQESVRLRLLRDMAVSSILLLITMGGITSFLFQRAIEGQVEAEAVRATAVEASGIAQSILAARAEVAPRDRGAAYIPLTPLTELGLAAVAVLVMAAVLSLILSGLVAAAVTSRLEAMRTAARQLAAGDLSRRVTPDEVDEIGALARTFNEMAEQMATGQEELAQHNEELERAVRARETFMAIASHELRTPLTPLRLTVDGLKARLGAGGVDERRLGRALDLMGRQVDRLEMLVEQLLDVSWLRAGHFSLDPTPMDLARLVDQVVARYHRRPSVPRIEVECRVRPVEGQWDPERLEQMLIQLIDNAIRYSPLRTSIRVTLRVRDGEVELLVVDQGIGIPPDTLPHLFQLFERGANASPRHFGGLGLGLYICREIVERHGGRIWAESEGPDRGSTFHAVLPWCPPSSARSLAQALK